MTNCPKKQKKGSTQWVTKRHIHLSSFITHLILLCCSITALAVTDNQAILATDQRQTNTAEIGALSMPEVANKLDRLIAETQHELNTINHINKLNLQLSPSTEPTEVVTTTKKLNYTLPFTLLTKDQIAQQLLHPLQQIYFKQEITSNQSTLRLNMSSLSSLLEQARQSSDNKLTYRILKGYFKDGTTFSGSDVQIKEDYDSDIFNLYDPITKLKVNKPISKMELEITYPAYPPYQRIILDNIHRSVTGNNGENYQLIDINDSTVSLRFTLPEQSSYVVNGLTATGEVLNSPSSHTVTLPSPQKIEQLNYYYQQLLETKNNIKQFTGAKQLNSRIEQITAEFTHQPNPLKVVQLTIKFDAPPQRIAIYQLEKPEQQKINHEINNLHANKHAYIAYDESAEQFGFMDGSGKWVVEPQFASIAESDEAENMYLFETKKQVSDTHNTNTYKYYYLIPETWQLQPIPFDNITEKIRDGVWLVQYEADGSYGLYNNKTGQFILPMKFVNPTIYGNLFIASLGKQTYGEPPNQYGVYTLDGKEILSTVYGFVEEAEGYLYATQAKDEQEQQHQQRDVFTLDGQQINAKGQRAIGVFSGHQPLLIQNIDNHEYHFIDRQGQVQPIVLPYDKVEPFSNGMAIVQKGDKKGVIDLSGQLTIPLDYEDLSAFQTNLAAAHIYDGNERVVVLINRNNQIVKRLGVMRYSQVSNNSNNAKYGIVDSQTNELLFFDADGNVIEDSDKQ